MLSNDGAKKGSPLRGVGHQQQTLRVDKQKPPFSIAIVLVFATIDAACIAVLLWTNRRV
jgi:hypothetical protein